MENSVNGLKWKEVWGDLRVISPDLAPPTPFAKTIVLRVKEEKISYNKTLIKTCKWCKGDLQPSRMLKETREQRGQQPEQNTKMQDPFRRKKNQSVENFNYFGQNCRRNTSIKTRIVYKKKDLYKNVKCPQNQQIFNRPSQKKYKNTNMMPHVVHPHIGLRNRTFDIE